MAPIARAFSGAGVSGFSQAERRFPKTVTIAPVAPATIFGLFLVIFRNFFKRK